MLPSTSLQCSIWKSLYFPYYFYPYRLARIYTFVCALFMTIYSLRNCWKYGSHDVVLSQFGTITIQVAMMYSGDSAELCATLESTLGWFPASSWFHIQTNFELGLLGWFYKSITCTCVRNVWYRNVRLLQTIKYVWNVGSFSTQQIAYSRAACSPGSIIFDARASWWGKVQEQTRMPNCH